MGFFDALKRSARPEDEYRDEYEDDFVYEEDEPEQDIPEEKVHRLNPRDDVQVVLVRPDRYEDASRIADHLRDMRVIVLNLERAEKGIARRMLDFLSGVAYAENGTIKKIAQMTYVVAPYFVDIMGDLDEDTENSNQFYRAQ